MHIKYTIILIIILTILLFIYKHKENNTGALVQLVAKGPQDYYLTGTNSLFPYYPYYPFYYPNYYPFYYPYYSRYYYPTRLRRRYFL